MSPVIASASSSVGTSIRVTRQIAGATSKIARPWAITCSCVAVSASNSMVSAVGVASSVSTVAIGLACCAATGPRPANAASPAISAKASITAATRRQRAPAGWFVTRSMTVASSMLRPSAVDSQSDLLLSMYALALRPDSVSELLVDQIDQFFTTLQAKDILPEDLDAASLLLRGRSGQVRRQDHVRVFPEGAPLGQRFGLGNVEARPGQPAG